MQTPPAHSRRRDRASVIKAVKTLRYIASLYKDKRRVKTTVQYLPEHKEVTVHYEDSSTVTFEQAGISPFNAWFVALIEDGQIPLNTPQEIIAACRKLLEFYQDPLGSRNCHMSSDGMPPIGKIAYDTFDAACAKCGATNSGFHIDHHLPKSKGHSLVPGNAVLLCPRCNIQKRNKHPNQFYSPVQLAIIESMLAHQKAAYEQ